VMDAELQRGRVAPQVSQRCLHDRTQRFTSGSKTTAPCIAGSPA
jgi:hypothetical protein